MDTIQSGLETRLGVAAPAQARWSDILLAWADRWRRWLLGALVLVYLAAFNGQWRIEPDSALYLTLAHNLASGKGYTYHDKPNATAYPGLPYALSICGRLFPAYHRDPIHLVPENLLMLLIGLATLALTYRLISLNAGRPTAVIVTCGLGLTRTFYRYVFAIMTDVPFLLSIMAFLVGYEAMVKRAAGRRVKWTDASLMVAGIAITIIMRPAWLAFVPVAMLAVAITSLRGKIPWKAAAIALIAASLAIALFFIADPRRAAGQFNVQRYEDQLAYQLTSGHTGALLATAADNARGIFREITTSAMFGVKFGSSASSTTPRHWYDYVGAAGSVLVTLVLLIFGIGLFYRRALWGFWVAATLAMMIVVLPHERYFLQALPLLVYAWWRWLRWVNLAVPGAAGNIAFALLLLLGIVPNLGQVGAIVIEQRRPHFYEHYKGGNYQPLLAAAKEIRSPSNVPYDAVVLAPDKTARILSYLSRRTVVEQNDLLLDVGWPVKQPLFVLDDHHNLQFQQWLAQLGIPPFTQLSASAINQHLKLRRILPSEILQEKQP